MPDTIRRLVDRRARHDGDGIFFVSPESGRTVTYRQLRDSFANVAAAIEDTDGGDIVGVMAGNGWAATQLLLGLPYLGRIAFLINLAAGDAQAAYMARHSGARLIFADADNFLRAQKIAAPGTRVLQIDRDEGAPAATAEKPLPPVASDTAALLIYTSGTTGKPKGVLHSHRGLLAGGGNTVLAHELTASDRALCVLPLYHINGQCVTLMAPLVSGGSVAVAHKFSARNFWRWIDECECTWFSIVPTLVSHLLHGDSPSRPPPKLKFGRSASSPLAPEIHRRFERRFGVPLMETMGLTETAAQILSNPRPPQKTKYGSAGRAFGCEVAVLDEKGKTNPPGAAGEIAVRGANLMLGYLRDDAATKAAFCKGWLLSGDLGYCDADGYFFVTGRRKELIIKGGENISPREIDEALLSAPNVAEAAAFAVPCPVYGQRVMAAVVLSAAGAHREEELIELCVDKAGKFKSPEKIYFVSALPKGPSGKIQRLALAERLSGGD